MYTLRHSYILLQVLIFVYDYGEIFHDLGLKRRREATIKLFTLHPRQISVLNLVQRHYDRVRYVRFARNRPKLLSIIFLFFFRKSPPKRVDALEKRRLKGCAFPAGPFNSCPLRVPRVSCTTQWRGRLPQDVLCFRDSSRLFIRKGLLGVCAFLEAELSDCVSDRFSGF